VATSLAAAGARLVLTSRLESDLGAVCGEIEAAGGEAHGVPLELTSMESVAGLAERVTGAVGDRLDFLVNNAGLMVGGSVGDMTEEDWDANLDVNLKGALFCTKALLGHLRRGPDGRVVNVSSIHALIGLPNRSAYAASKGGLVAMTRQLAVELGPDGITVNVVCPGVIPTRMTEHRLASPQHRRDLMATIPLRRLGTAEDVGAAVTFLCAPAGAYVTGQVIAVDGGWSVT
jgi:NAD(P)-dependent dehydrogenase (short-subunit alcohol dehydrogenase family)